MATTKTKIDQGVGFEVWKWEGLACGEVGDSLPLRGFLDNTLQVVGEFNSETLTLQGSNEGTDWVTIKDLDGADVALTTGDAAPVLRTSTAIVRPSFSGASGGDLDITLRLGKG